MATVTRHVIEVGDNEQLTLLFGPSESKSFVHVRNQQRGVAVDRGNVVAVIHQVSASPWTADRMNC